MKFVGDNPKPASPVRYYLVALTIIALDQLVKYFTHTRMLMGPAGEVPLLGDWFKLH